MPALTLDELRQMIATRTRVSIGAITRETDLEDAGIESKDYADLLTELDVAYGISIDSGSAADVATVGDLFDLASRGALSTTVNRS